MQIKKSYRKDNLKNQELLLRLDAISPMWSKKLEESKLLPLFSLRRLQMYLELKHASKCVVGEAYGCSSSYVDNCERCCDIAWKFMFYFMIHSYSKLERTKKEFVKHWNNKHHHQQPLFPNDDMTNMESYSEGKLVLY
jgi:hypothetical protein